MTTPDTLEPSRRQNQLVATVEFAVGRADEFRWSLVLSWYDGDSELRRCVVDERESGLGLAQWLADAVKEGVNAVMNGGSHSSSYVEPWTPDVASAQ
jgi:hypothetical protein